MDLLKRLNGDEMQLIRKIKRFINNRIKDQKSRFYLKKNMDSLKGENEKIKIGFIVQLPEIWDKQSDVYDIMQTSENIDVYLIVVPSFDFENDILCEYGDEREYFNSKYSNVMDAISENGEIINIEEENFNYIFYQRPYDRYLPKELRSDEVVKHTKICYIPYGFIGANVFNNSKLRDFFRNVYIGFMDSKDECESMKKVYKRNIKRGYQNYVDLGYPVLEKFLYMDSDREINNILWTPRWSYDAIIGGSHFVEYKDNIIALKKRHKDINVIIRPHPLTFPNMIKEGKMTAQDVEKYKREIKECNVQIDRNEMIEQSISNTDILITDFSSIMIMFFLTGKPMIYCQSELELNDVYNKMLKGVYVANSWADVEKYIEEICKGNDYLKEIRQEIIETDFENIKNSAKRIVDYIIQDYYE